MMHRSCLALPGLATIWCVCEDRYFSFNSRDVEAAVRSPCVSGYLYGEPSTGTLFGDVLGVFRGQVQCVLKAIQYTGVVWEWCLQHLQFSIFYLARHWLREEQCALGNRVPDGKLCGRWEHDVVHVRREYQNRTNVC